MVQNYFLFDFTFFTISHHLYFFPRTLFKYFYFSLHYFTFFTQTSPSIISNEFCFSYLPFYLPFLFVLPQIRPKIVYPLMSYNRPESQSRILSFLRPLVSLCTLTSCRTRQISQLTHRPRKEGESWNRLLLFCPSLSCWVVSSPWPTSSSFRSPLRTRSVIQIHLKTLILKRNLADLQVVSQHADSTAIAESRWSHERVFSEASCFGHNFAGISSNNTMHSFLAKRW